jgi:hypothetical protein
LGLPTFPSRRFVAAGGLTVVHEGLNEYELIDIEHGAASTLAFTVVRSTGMLSRLGMTNRPFPAGPLTPVEGLQMVGSPIRASYVIGANVDPWALAERAFSPLDVVKAEGGGSRPSSGMALQVSGAIVSSVRREAGDLEVRVFNPTESQSAVNIGDLRGFLVDLRGVHVASVHSEFMLSPHRFATLRIREDDSHSSIS